MMTFPMRGMFGKTIQVSVIKSIRIMRRVILLSVVMCVAVSAFAAVPLCDGHSEWRKIYRLTEEQEKEFVDSKRKDGGADVLAEIVRSEAVDSVQYDTEVADAIETKINELPTGNYLVVWAEGNMLRGEIKRNGEVHLFVRKSVPGRAELMLTDREGMALSDAEVTVGGRRAKASGCGIYVAKVGKKERSVVVSVSREGRNEYFSVAVNEPVREWSYKTARDKSDIYAKSFITTDKPEYKPGETLKWKAYIVDFKGRAMTETMRVTMSGYVRGGGYKEISLGEIAPVSDGVFAGQTVLADSLGLREGASYSLCLTDRKGRRSPIAYWRYKDYKLTGVRMTAEAPEVQYRGKDAVLRVKAVDDNGQRLPYGEIKVTARAVRVEDIFADRVVMKDELYSIETGLLPDGDTEIVLPSGGMPAANMMYSCRVTLTDAERNSYTQTVYIMYYHEREEMKVERAGRGKVVMHCMRNGEKTTRDVEVYGVADDGTRRLLYKGQSEKEIAVPQIYIGLYAVCGERSEYMVPDVYSRAECSAEIEDDTVRIDIAREDGGEFNYMIYCGKELVAEGCDSLVAMREKVRRREDYTVMVSYVSNGEMYNSKAVAPYDCNRLYVNVEKPDAVKPGDSAEVVIRVRDISGQPVGGADITAMAVTAKFGDAWGRGVMPQAWEEQDEGYEHIPGSTGRGLTRSAERRVDSAAFAAFALQEMDYYRFMYSDKAVAEHRAPTYDGSAQIAPYIVRNGTVTPTVYVMIDWQPVWAGWATQRQPYSFAVREGRHSVAVRTADKLYAVKNVTVKRGEKLMLAIREDGEAVEPYKVAAERMPKRLTADEERYFSRYMLMPYKINGNDGAAYLKGRRGDIYMLEDEAGNMWVNRGIRTVALFGRQGTAVYDKGVSADSIPFFGKEGYAYGLDFGTGSTVMAGTDVKQLPGRLKDVGADVSGTLCDSALTAEAINRDMRRRIARQRRGMYPTVVGKRAEKTGVLHCVGAGESVLNYMVLDFETDSVAAYAGAMYGDFYDLKQGKYRIVSLLEGGAWSEDTITVVGATTYFRPDSTVRHETNGRVKEYNSMMDSIVASRYNVEASMYRWQQMVESLTGNGSKEERGYMVADNRAAFGTAAPMAVPNAMMSNRVMSKSMADGAVAFEEATAAGMDVEAVMEEIRSAFSDVAYWYPTLRTDERGEVRVTVRYPDDLTRWNEYFVAMKGRQRGFEQATTTARLDVVGKLYVPQFLTESDTVGVVGNAVNYTDTAMTLGRSFIVEDDVAMSITGSVENAVFDTVAVAAEGDSVTVAYAVTGADGEYIDGEKRSVGVQQRGMLKTDGEFHIMAAGKEVYTIGAERYDRPFELHIEGDVMELMKRDAERVLDYKFETNDVLAAKLTVLLMMQTDKGLKPMERARNAQKINSIIGRMERNRNADGLWGWYGRSDESVWFVTEAVFRALSKAYDMGYEVGTMRDKRYVAYALGAMEAGSEDEKVEAALLMAEIIMPEAATEYQTIKETIETDSLSELGRLKYCLLSAYMGERCDAIDADTMAVRSMTGGLHYELRGTRAEARRGVVSGDVEATLTVYRMLGSGLDTEGAAEKRKAIRRWLLSQRRYGGYWRNFSECIKILDVLMSENDAYGHEPMEAVVTAGGNTFTVKELPFDTVFPAGTEVTIEKKGGCEVFVGTAVRYWEQDVTAAGDEGMRVGTEWACGGDTLKTGEETGLRVRLTMERDADYVMVRVPIPAGCELKRGVYGKRYGRLYTECYRDEACLFFEYLPKGEYEYTLRVVNRFAGRFTQNPVQAELFYFPMLGANGEMRRVVIE